MGGLLLVLAALAVLGLALLVLCVLTEAAGIRRVQQLQRDDLGLDR